MSRMESCRRWTAVILLSSLVVIVLLGSAVTATSDKLVLHTLNSGLVTLNNQQEADLNVTNLSDTLVKLNAAIIDAGGKVLATKSLSMAPQGSDTLAFSVMSTAKVRGMISIEGSPKLLCDRFKPTLEIINPNGGNPAASVVLSNFTHIDEPL